RAEHRTHFRRALRCLGCSGNRDLPAVRAASLTFASLMRAPQSPNVLRMRKDDPQKKEPQCAEVYLKTHVYKDGTFMDGKTANDLKKKLIETSEGSTSQGKVAWQGDPYSEIIGKDKRGYMRGVGLGPTPKDIFNSSCLRRFEGLRMTNFDETIVEENIRQMKEHMERLEMQVQDQNKIILDQNKSIAELKYMVQCLANNQPMQLLMPVELNIQDIGGIEKFLKRNTSGSANFGTNSKLKRPMRSKEIVSDASSARNIHPQPHCPSGSTS
ncbi:hypothetical protein ACMD2_17743, partial [Ananas comosus]